MPFHDDALVEHEGRQAPLGGVPKGLPALWRVDAGKADLVLRPFCVEHGNAVAVGDADDMALQLVRRRSMCGCRQSDERNEEGGFEKGE